VNSKHDIPGGTGRKETSPVLKVHEKAQVGEEGGIGATLDELAREGARRLLATALEAEVAAYVEEHPTGAR
jgi:hypothetical protein